MAAMLLAEMGADVIRVDRTADSGLGIALNNKYQLLQRSRRSIAVDLKSDEGRALVLDLVEQAGSRRIEGVVEIEHPVGDVGKRILDHVPGLGQQSAQFNARLDRCG